MATFSKDPKLLAQIRKESKVELLGQIPMTPSTGVRIP